MTLSERLAAATATLAASGIEAPRREARLLLQHATGLDGAGLLARMHDPLDGTALDRLVARRAAREPLALITGHQPFWTLDLAVSPDTLIPRADSESLIEALVAAAPDRTGLARILDLGTGTGCLLLSALVEYPAAWGLGVDRIPAAASLARRNAATAEVAGRAAFLCGDWAAALAGRFDAILCNPPYIGAADIQALMPEVGLYEPGSALDGGDDGLDAYRAVIPSLDGLLSGQGLAILELGQGQGPAVVALALAHGLQPVATRADLGGVDRALVLRRAI